MAFMKIALAGAQGTGKTTAALGLQAAMRAELPGLAINIMPEVARQCPWPINEETTAEGQRWIFHRQVLTELEAGSECDVLICDRSVIDNLMYSTWARMGGGATIYEWSWVDHALDYAYDWLASYDLIWLMEPEAAPGALVDDGRRSVNPDFQNQVAALFRQQLTTIDVRNGYKAVLVEPFEIWPGEAEAKALLWAAISERLKFNSGKALEPQRIFQKSLQRQRNQP